MLTNSRIKEGQERDKMWLGLKLLTCGGLVEKTDDLVSITPLNEGFKKGLYMFTIEWLIYAFMDGWLATHE